MATIYNGRALIPGDLIPGTALTFVQSISRRRAEFRCGCGKEKVYWISDLEQGRRFSCGCGYHKKLYYQPHKVKMGDKYVTVMRHVDSIKKLEILDTNNKEE